MARKRKKKLDTLGRVMSKVARRKKLSKQDRKIIGAAVDGAKKSKRERRKKRKRKKKKRR